MKKAIFFLALFLCITTVFAQTQMKDTLLLKQVMELKINQEGGANGAGVAWNPITKRYYCAMAGNASFPMVVFDATGKQLSDESVSTLIDVRGLWFNPKAKALQANGYNDAGWVSYTLDAKGIPASVTTLFAGMNQPYEQAVGAFHAAANELYFIDAVEYFDISSYSMIDGKYRGSTTVHPQTIFEFDIDEDLDLTVMEDYNLTTPVYTSIPTAEIGLLNVVLSQIELYNLNDGLMTKVLQLPAGAPVNDMFNFSYCNKIYWLFDKDSRKWIGYK